MDKHDKFLEELSRLCDKYKLIPLSFEFAIHGEEWIEEIKGDDPEGLPEGGYYSISLKHNDELHEKFLKRKQEK